MSVAPLHNPEFLARRLPACGQAPLVLLGDATLGFTALSLAAAFAGRTLAVLDCAEMQNPFDVDSGFWVCSVDGEHALLVVHNAEALPARLEGAMREGVSARLQSGLPTAVTAVGTPSWVHGADELLLGQCRGDGRRGPGAPPEPPEAMDGARQRVLAALDAPNSSPETVPIALPPSPCPSRVAARSTAR
jgi:hypothetical protein